MCQFDAGPHEFDHTGKLKLKLGILTMISDTLDSKSNRLLMLRKYSFCSLFMQAGIGVDQYLKIR